MHPDTKGGDETIDIDKFKEITAAYDVLSNRDKKAFYDGFVKPAEVNKKWSSTTEYEGFYKSTYSRTTTDDYTKYRQQQSKG